MTSLLATPPQSVCILRLSTIGDVCHALPLVRTLQQEWPATRFTWIIGLSALRLVHSIPDIEFVPFDDTRGLAERGDLKRRLRGRRFDLLLHLQPTLLANAVAAAISAKIKLGFDASRARRLQWLFTTHRIESAERQHAVDACFGFAERLGVRERRLRWDIPLDDATNDFAQNLVPDGMPTMMINPCATPRMRSWRAEYYAQAADFAATAYGMRIALCGGRSAFDKRMGEHIVGHMRQPCVNAIGKDTLPALAAALSRATLLLTPDSDVAHLATAFGTPVLGLYAATSSLCNGPYLSRQLCVDKYDAAARALLGKPSSDIPWGTAIDREGVMDLITPDDVIKKLQSFMAQRSRRR
jgi:heptosyltransferase I